MFEFSLQFVEGDLILFGDVVQSIDFELQIVQLNLILSDFLLGSFKLLFLLVQESHIVLL